MTRLPHSIGRTLLLAAFVPALAAAQVDVPAWRAPQRVTPNPGTYSNLRVVGNGVQHCLAFDSSAGFHWAVRQGGAWVHQVLPGSGGCTRPDVAMAGQRVFVVGMQGNSRIVLFRSQDGGASWSGPTQVNDATNVAVFQPRIAVNPATQRICATWSGTTVSDSAFDVKYTTSDDGGQTFTREIDVSDSTGVQSRNAVPLIFPDFRNSTIVAWREDLTGNAMLCTRHRPDDSGAFGPAVTVANVANPGVSTGPSVASSGAGNSAQFSIAWSDRPSSQPQADVYFRDSMDRAATYGPIVNVTGTGATADRFPVLSPLGVVGALMYEDLGRPDPLLITVTTDHGRTFTQPEPIPAPAGVVPGSGAMAFDGACIVVAYVDRAASPTDVYAVEAPVPHVLEPAGSGGCPAPSGVADLQVPDPFGNDVGLRVVGEPNSPQALVIGLGILPGPFRLANGCPVDLDLSAHIAVPGITDASGRATFIFPGPFPGLRVGVQSVDAARLTTSRAGVLRGN